MNEHLITIAASFAGTLVGSAIGLYLYLTWKRRADLRTLKEIQSQQIESTENFARIMEKHFLHDPWGGNDAGLDRIAPRT